MGLASFPGGGGAAPAVSVAVGDLDDIGTVGDDVARANSVAEVVTALGGASSVRAAIDAAEDGAGPSADVDPLSGSGWAIDTPSGGASATWATGPARLLLSCAPGGAGACSVSHATRLPNGSDYSAAVRLRVLRGDNSNATRLALVCGRSANDCVVMMLFTNGSIEIGVVTGGVYAYWSIANTIAALDNAARTGGELWLRFDRRGATLTWFWGLNTGASGALPTAWNPVYSSVVRHVAGQDAQAYAGAKASGGRFLRVSASTLSALDLGVRVDAIVTGPPGSFDTA